MDSPSQLTDDERKVLSLYRQPNRRDMRRMLRLSVQYALAGGIFTALALIYRQPAFVLVVYVLFIASLAARVLGAKKLAGVMPRVIAKYDQEIAGLRDQLAVLAARQSGRPETGAREQAPP